MTNDEKHAKPPVNLETNAGESKASAARGAVMNAPKPSSWNWQQLLCWAIIGATFATLAVFICGAAGIIAGGFTAGFTAVGSVGGMTAGAVITAMFGAAVSVAMRYCWQHRPTLTSTNDDQTSSATSSSHTCPASSSLRSRRTDFTSSALPRNIHGLFPTPAAAATSMATRASSPTAGPSREFG